MPKLRRELPYRGLAVASGEPGDIRGPAGEEFYLVEFGDLPWRISEHHVETTTLENVRELELPVKEVSLPCERLYG